MAVYEYVTAEIGSSRRVDEATGCDIHTSQDTLLLPRIFYPGNRAYGA